jgi:nucleotide-binding universal stress UspA family protein
VLRDEHDLVIMTADSWKGARNFAFGSTSLHMLRKCPCPVWVISPHAEEHFSSILAAVDPSGEDDTDPANALDRKILELASSLSHSEPCQSLVVHAWELDGAERDTARSGISADMTDKIVRRSRDRRETAVRGLINETKINGQTPDVLLPRGEPWRAIPQIAREQAVDLIVMGTVTRTGIAGLLIGDTAEHILQQVDCSILAVKPDGFRTPVTLED